ncbi:MAG: hypothetical protein K0S07_160, partial [Chlamydiales bacterium]|nr:hypothetical protein [Chlamydiales bacterium]
MHSSRNFIFCILLFPILFSSCANYKISTEDYTERSMPSIEQIDAFCKERSLPPAEFAPHFLKRRNLASRHWIYRVIPRHRSQIRWFDVGHWLSWGLLGNDDDGLFGEELTAGYRLQEGPKPALALCWAARNPLHNFCFYVIGQAYWKNSAIQILTLSDRDCSLFRYQEEGRQVFVGDKFGLYLVLHGLKPFISL